MSKKDFIDRLKYSPEEKCGKELTEKYEKQLSGATTESEFNKFLFSLSHSEKYYICCYLGRKEFDD